RQFPATEPCTNWGDHCPGTASSNGMAYGDGVGGGIPYTGVPQFQQQMILQQPLGGQNLQYQQAPIINGAPQGNYNSYNANPAPAPPAQQSIAPRTFGAQPPSGDAASGNEAGSGGSGTRNNVPQDNSQLQLPGLDEDAGDFQLPDIPDLSQRSPYYNQRPAGQAYGNQYHQVAQSIMPDSYAQPLMPPNANMMAAGPQNGMANQQQQYAQQQYAQQQYPTQVQQPYNQAMQQQQMMAPGYPQQQAYPQQGNQYQAPQQNHYRSQPASIQVVPGRQPSIVGVSYSQSIRPAANNMNMQQPVPVQKQSFLSKINPFSK
ncbi:MAG: hypothetical protein ABJZ55_05215, partial [Fuerstiella sp.]